MLPVVVVRRILRVRIKVSRNRLIQIGIAVLLLAIVFAVAFSYFEGVDLFTAFYWAVITMATIGYGDVTPKTEAGRIVAMIASVAGISTFTALVSLLAENFISSSIRRMMGMHRVKYSGHYLVIGRGSSVSTCVNELLGAIERGELKLAPIVVVFPDEEERKRVELPEETEVLIGDPTSRETLERAGVERASHVVLALEDDSRAVFVTLMVKRMSRAKVFVEVLSEESVELLKGAGADRVIVSRSLAGRLLASSIFEPEVVDVIDDITSSVKGYDVTVIEGSSFWGRPYIDALRKLKEERDLFLLGYYLDGPVLNPPFEEPIPEGAKLIVLRSSASTGKS